jgi:hypothetical protein
MGNGCLDKIGNYYAPITPESERLKVTALNLFHPTAYPSSSNNRFFVLRHSLIKEEKMAKDVEERLIQVCRSEI